MTAPTTRRPLFERGTAPARWVVSVAIGIALISMVSGWIGDALLAELVDRRPVWP